MKMETLVDDPDDEDRGGVDVRISEGDTDHTLEGVIGT